MEPTDQIQAVLERTPQIRLAVLFGSRARGTARERSDVDLALLLEPSSAELKTQLEVELGRACTVPVEVVYLESAPPQLRFEIARDGRPLLVRDPSAWVSFKRQAMLDWWDWAPYAKRIHEAAIRRLREQVKHGPA